MDETLENLDEECQNCRFCRLVAVEDERSFYECHKAPPVYAEGEMSLWPAVDPTDWCGAWTPGMDAGERRTERAIRADLEEAERQALDAKP